MKHDIKNTIKLGLEYPYYHRVINNLDKNHRFNIILGTPVHENLGDHLITYSEKLYLKEKSSIKCTIEIPIEAYKLFKAKIIKNVSKEATIFINGGGWMGNIWPNDECLLEDMVSSFPQNKIIIFPQSIYYDEKSDDFFKLIKQSARVIDNAKNLTLFVRDKQSFYRAKSIYPSSEIYLVPDITLYLKERELFQGATKPKVRNIGICMRSDREKNLEENLINSCIQYCVERRFRLVNVSTTKKIRIPSFAREKAIKNLIRSYKTCRLVITDRLHGMIFAYLSGIPCVVFDNSTGKISGVYNAWLKNSKNIFMINDDNRSNVKENLNCFLNKADIDSREMFDFSQLERVIRDGEN